MVVGPCLTALNTLICKVFFMLSFSKHGPGTPGGYPRLFQELHKLEIILVIAYIGSTDPFILIFSRRYSGSSQKL